MVKILVGASREGWHDFNAELPAYSNVYERRPDTPCGDDTMLMLFTSGTSGLSAYRRLTPINIRSATISPQNIGITSIPRACTTPFPIPAGVKLYGANYMVSGCAKQASLPTTLIVSIRMISCRCLLNIISLLSVHRQLCIVCSSKKI